MPLIQKKHTFPVERENQLTVCWHSKRHRWFPQISSNSIVSSELDDESTSSIKVMCDLGMQDYVWKPIHVIITFLGTIQHILFPC